MLSVVSALFRCKCLFDNNTVYRPGGPSHSIVAVHPWQWSTGIFTSIAIEPCSYLWCVSWRIEGHCFIRRVRIYETWNRQTLTFVDWHVQKAMQLFFHSSSHIFICYIDYTCFTSAIIYECSQSLAFFNHFNPNRYLVYAQFYWL